jgi:hypothetical protein
VGRAEGCGYPHDVDLTIATDVFETCAIDPVLLKRSVENQPCRELAALTLKHESTHAQNCAKRMAEGGKLWPYTVNGANGESKTRYLPPLLLTPAGKAAEEVACYEAEVAELKKMIQELEERCRPKRHYSGEDAVNDKVSPKPDGPLPSYEPKPIAPPPSYQPKPIKAPPMPKPKPIPNAPNR